MKRRIVATLLLIVILMSMLAACGTDKPDPTEPPATQQPTTNQGGEQNKPTEPPKTVGNFQVPEGGYDGSEVTIKFYHTMGSNLSTVLDLYIEEFNKLYPNIHVESSSVGGYDDVREQISTEITVGNQPNIAYCYPDHVALYNMANAVQSLDVLIDADKTVKVKDKAGNEIELPIGLTQEQIDDFIQGYYNEGRQFGDGKMYSLPLSKSTEVLYYNKTYFEANNISVPTTWDELEAVCRRILEIENYNPTCVPLGYDSESNWFITMCEQLGSPYTSATGTKYLFNNDTNKQFVERFASWYYDGLITTQEIYGAYTSGMFVQQDKTKTYSFMSIGSSAGATNQRPTKGADGYPFEVGIAPIPQVDPSNPKVISQGPSLVILNNENRQEVIASWLFVKYLTTCIEFQAEFSMVSGYMPVLESVMENPVYKEDFLDKADGGDNIAALSVKVGLQMKNAYYVSPAFTGSSVARDEVGNIMQNVFINYGAYSNKAELLDEQFANAIAICERKYPSSN